MLKRQAVISHILILGFDCDLIVINFIISGILCMCRCRQMPSARPDYKVNLILNVVHTKKADRRQQTGTETTLDQYVYEILI